MAPVATPLDSRTSTDDDARVVKPRRKWPRAVAIGLLALGVVFGRPAVRHVEAASLLSRFSSAEAANAVNVDEREVTFPAPRGNVAGRLFVPRGVDAPPGVVLVHGLHYRGIEEPRLRRFARAIAATGVTVFTPQIDELADYQVAPASIETTGAAVDWLRGELGKNQVGLMGTSFGGGLALLTAARPTWSDKVSFVTTIGAHDDLERVTRFFATGKIVDPEGNPQGVKPHDYGAMVFIFANAEDFFPRDEVPAARQAIRFWLMENRELAHATADLMSAEGKKKVETIFSDDWSTVRPEILAVIDRHQDDMRTVSPHGHLEGLRAPVYFLHGAGDAVVPASESLWLAKDAPRSKVRSVLISPALVHVELGDVSVADRARLVHFMAEIIEASRGAE